MHHGLWSDGEQRGSTSLRQEERLHGGCKDAPSETTQGEGKAPFIHPTNSFWRLYQCSDAALGLGRCGLNPTAKSLPLQNLHS